jgi:phosphoribosylformylglycinamidine cyclo-ligase
MTSKPLTYKDAGVDIDAGNELVQRIKPLVAKTSRSEVLTGIGGFGGLFALDTDKYQQPVLVSGTDGVGTKLKLAHDLNVHDTIGIDLVAMCVNDVIVQGAEPLFFLDYFACGKLDGDVASSVIAGIADGCQQSGAALIGGETAEMPDMYADGEYDLAGFCVGAVERRKIIDGSSITAGDAIIGIASSGPHSNGYSLIRKVLQLVDSPTIDGRNAAQLLLTPTRIYARAVLDLLDKVTVKGLAHITGGGITENLPRVLHGEVHPQLDLASWQAGPVFDWLAASGNISDDEMRRTFNCGVGMCAVVEEKDTEIAIAALSASGETAWRLGTIAAGAGEVEYI